MSIRFLGCLAALLLLVPDVASASSRHSGDVPKITRIEVAPGVTMAFGRTWAACDKATNARLGAMPLPKEALTGVCNLTGAETQEARFIHLAPQAITLLTVGYQTNAFATDAMLGSLTPDLAAGLNQYECNYVDVELGIDKSAIEQCAYEPYTLAGHRTLTARLIVKRSDLLPRHVLRAFYVPYEQGYLALQFEVVASAEQAAAPIIEAVLAGLAITPPASPQAPSAAVTLTPAPGVTMAVPMGWKACDDTTDALLGRVFVPQRILRLTCAQLASDTSDAKMQVGNPQTLQDVTVRVDFMLVQPFSERDLERLSDGVTEFGDKSCAKVTGDATSAGETVQSCSYALGELGGHRALVATMEARPANSVPIEMARITIYMVPYSHGYLRLTVIVPLAMQTLNQPVADALLKTVSVTQ